jgi:hypothetical protein
MSLFTPTSGINLSAVAQRTEIIPYMEIEAGAYYQMAEGWTVYTENPNAQTKERKFINDTTSSTSITSYKPTYAFEALLYYNDPAIAKVYDIAKSRKTGANARVPLILVDKFAAEVSGAYPARKLTATVGVSSFDDDDDIILKGNFNAWGTEIAGTFNPTTGTFTEET